MRTFNQRQKLYYSYSIILYYYTIRIDYNIVNSYSIIVILRKLTGTQALIVLYTLQGWAMLQIVVECYLFFHLYKLRHLAEKSKFMATWGHTWIN